MLIFRVFVSIAVAAYSILPFAVGQEVPVTGLIRDAVTRQPIPGAAVTIAPVDSDTRPVGRRLPVLSEADGRFEIKDLAAGRYELSVTARGYLPQRYGSSRPGGPARILDVVAGLPVTSLVIELWKSPVLAGQVFDERGNPLPGVQVGTLRRTTTKGRVSYAIGAGAVTDERGSYRVEVGLPGNYVVKVVSGTTTFSDASLSLFASARAGNVADQVALDEALKSTSAPVDFSAGFRQGNWSVIPPRGGTALLKQVNGRFQVAVETFHTAANLPDDATVVPLQAGEERVGVNVVPRFVATNSVSGQLHNLDGTPAQLVGLRLAPEGVGDLGALEAMQTSATITDRSGRFTFAAVPPGTYRVRGLVKGRPASASDSSQPVQCLEEQLVVGDHDLRDVTFRLTAPFRIVGRILFKQSKPSPDQLGRLRIDVVPAEATNASTPSPVRATLSPDGDFEVFPVVPGRHFLRVTGPSGWSVLTAEAHGQDISDEPIFIERDTSNVIIRMSDDAGELSGTVRDVSGSVDPVALVLIFPVDQKKTGMRRWHALPVDTFGRYRIIGLPKGEYFFAAIAERDALGWEEPNFLRALVPLATRVNVSGTREAIDLRTSKTR